MLSCITCYVIEHVMLRYIRCYITFYFMLSSRYVMLFMPSFLPSQTYQLSRYIA